MSDATTRSLADVNAAGPWLDQWAATDAALLIIDALAAARRAGRTSTLTADDVRLRDDGTVELTDHAAAGAVVAPADDVRAIGAMLFEMLAGRAPGDDDPLRALRLRSAIDPRLAQVVARAVDPASDGRPASLRTFRTELAALRVPLSAPTQMQRVLLDPGAHAAARQPAPGGRRPHWVALLTVLSLVLVAGLAFLLLRDDGSSDVVVPNVAGLPADQAEQQLIDAGLLPLRIDEPSVAVPVGIAIRTAPAAGTKVATGSRVFVAVSGQAESGVVPTVVGLPQSEAASILSQFGLSATYTQQSSLAPAGTVIAQSPPPGRQVQPVSVVQLTVSTGPAATTTPPVVPPTTTPTTPTVPTTPDTTTTVPPPSTTTTPPATTVQVPDVVGQTVPDATDLIEQAGLAVGTVTYGSGSQTPGTVISQSPAAGASVVQGTLVSLMAAQ